MGVSGAGKTEIGSRFARTIGAEFVEGDAYHPPANVEKMAAGTPLTDEDRQGWLHAIGERIHRANDLGVGVVVSCSALKRSYRDAIRSDAGRVQFIFLAGDPALIAQRLSSRKGHFMPMSLLESQLATLEEPSADEDVWVVDITRPPAEIVALLLARASA